MIMQWMWIVVAAIVCAKGTPEAQAQTASTMPVESTRGLELLEQGRGQLFDLRLDAAHESFRRLADEEGATAVAAYHRSTAYLLEGLIIDEEEAFDVFFEYTEVYEKSVDDMPASVWRDYFDGEMHLHRAMAYVKTERYVQAALSARRAYKAFDRVVERDSGFSEAYKGRGILHLAIGATPGGYRRILHVLGYEGEVEQGLRELKVASEQSRYGREESMLIRALIAVTMSHDPKQSLAIMQEMRMAHPKSPLVAYLYGFVLLSNRQAEEAERVLRQTYEYINRPGTLYVDYVDFYLAEALFFQNEFAEAEQVYRRYLDRHNGPALRSMALLKTALALEMQGRRDEARAFYSQVESERDYDSDRWARKEARARLVAPMTDTEKALLRARNHFDAGRYDRSVPVLKRLFADDQQPRSVRAEAAYRLGRLYHVQEAYSQAVKYYQWAVSHPLDDGSKWAPWGQFYIGTIHLEQERFEAAAAALHAALEYDGDYSYKYGLEQRAKAALERVATERE